MDMQSNAWAVLHDSVSRRYSGPAFEHALSWCERWIDDNVDQDKIGPATAASAALTEYVRAGGR